MHDRWDSRDDPDEFKVDPAGSRTVPSYCLPFFYNFIHFHWVDAAVEAAGAEGKKQTGFDEAADYIRKAVDKEEEAFRVLDKGMR